MPEKIRIPGVKVGKHTGPITNKAFIEEARARYTWAWNALKAERKALEEAGKPVHAQLFSMSGNAITADFDRVDEEWAALPAALRQESILQQQSRTEYEGWLLTAEGMAFTEKMRLRKLAHSGSKE